MTRAVAAAVLALALTGCIRFGPKPPPELLRLMPAEQVRAGTGQTVNPVLAIAVQLPTVPAELANNRVPVIARDTAVAYVKDAVWVDPPARLFQALLAETITARTGRPVIPARTSIQDPATRLSGRLLMFGVDAQTREATVRFDGVIDRNNAVRTRRFEARVPVAGEIEAATVGLALNQAANRVAGEVADWAR